jgi:hypothetical protein
MEGIDVVSLSGISSGEPPLGEQLASMASQTRDEAKEKDEQQEKKKEPTKLEISLVYNFTLLGKKFDKIKDAINQQLDIVSDFIESDNDIMSELYKMKDNFEVRSNLERELFSIIRDKYTQPFEIPEVENVTPAEKVVPEPIPDPWEDTPEDNTSEEPDKKAEGTISPPTATKPQFLPDKQTDEKFATTMQLPLESSGIGGLSLVSEFLKSIGPLASIFNSSIDVYADMGDRLGIPRDISMRFLRGPIFGSFSDVTNMQKEFGKTWASILKNDDLIDKYIDREGDPSDPNRPPGFVPAKWDEDPEFVEALNEMCSRLGISAPGLLAIMARESGIRPDAENPDTGAVGLIQLNPVYKVPESVGTTAAALKKMTRKEQLPYIEKYLTSRGVKSGMTPGDIYAIIFVPGFARETNHLPIGSAERGEAILTDSSQEEYKRNDKLDDNQDGKITRNDLTEQLKKTAKAFKIQGFEKGGTKGFVSKANRNLMPYIVTGPESGFDYTIVDGAGIPHEVELHGKELIAPTLSGFKVFPIENRKYSLTKNPEKVINRWEKISGGLNLEKSSKINVKTVVQQPPALESPVISNIPHENINIVKDVVSSLDKQDYCIKVIRDEMVKIYDIPELPSINSFETNYNYQQPQQKKRTVVGIVSSPQQQSMSIASQSSGAQVPVAVPVFDAMKYRQELSIVR